MKLFSKLFTRAKEAVTTVSLDRLLEQYLLHHEAQGSAERTVIWYGQMIDSYQKWLDEQGITWPEWCEKTTVEKYLAAQRKAYAPRTIDGRFRALKALFTWAVAENKLQGRPSPVANMARPKVPKDAPGRATVEEYQKLLGSIGRGTGMETWLDLRDRAIIAVLFSSGLRVGELVGLHVDDVDMGNRLIHVRRGKGAKARFVPLSEEAKLLLFTYLMNRPPWAGPELWLASSVALNPQGGLQVPGVRRAIYRRCKEAGIRPLNPHAFRHAFATEMLNRGGELSAISRIMGHADTRITERTYAEWNVSGLQAAHSRVWDSE